MQSDRELMQQALEAMGTVGADHICQASHHAKKDQHQWGEICPLQQRWHIAFQALRERLAQPEQEPVAWYCKEGLKRGVSLWQENPEWRPLYTAPPRREWVGLTDGEIRSLNNWWPSYDDRTALMVLIRDAEAKLKEKNT